VLAACTGREIRVDVAIPGPDSVDAPVAHLGLVALPYDRDSLLKALAASHPEPTSLTRPLDSLFRAYRGPFTTYATLSFQVQRQEHRLAQLRLRLDSLSRASSEYGSLYRSFATGSDSLAELHRRRDQAQRVLAEARHRLTPAIDSLRQLHARWQGEAYHGYDSITKLLGTGIGREPRADSTGGDGTVRLHLPPGDWWIYARSWDTWDPYSEWYWNVPVTGDRVVLDRSTGRRLPRY
jgi:hypothetical protein